MPRDAQLELPVFAVRSGVLFPGMVAPFDVGRRPSLAAVEEAETRQPPLLLVVVQKAPDVEEPTQADLHTVGCIAEVFGHEHSARGGGYRHPPQHRVILHGRERVAVAEVTRTPSLARAKVSRFPPDGALTHAERSLVEEIREGAIALARAPGVPPEAVDVLKQIREPANLVDLVAGNIEAPIDMKLRWLAAPLAERIMLVLERILTLKIKSREG